MDPHEVDQAIADQRQVLVDVDKEFAHREWCAGLLADDAEIVDVLWREGVFQEEEVIGLDVLRQLDGLDRRDVLVNIMAELEFVAERSPEALEHAGDHAAIRGRLE